MEQIRPYIGTKPYIFISYAHKNSEEVQPIIRQLMADGYRVWYDEGIVPGSEWDDDIARHVEHCGCMLAMVSEDYLASNNCKDELDYARDLDKPRLLIYLEKVTLPSGMRMRLGRLQAVFKYSYPEPEKFYSKIYEAELLAPCRQAADEPAEPSAEDMPSDADVGGDILLARARQAEAHRKEVQYQQAAAAMVTGTSVACREAADQLAALEGYKDAAELSIQCRQQAEELEQSEAVQQEEDTRLTAERRRTLPLRSVLWIAFGLITLFNLIVAISLKGSGFEWVNYVTLSLATFLFFRSHRFDLKRIYHLFSPLFFYLCQSFLWLFVSVMVKTEANAGAYPFFLQLLVLSTNLFFLAELLYPVRLSRFSGWAVSVVPFLYCMFLLVVFTSDIRVIGVSVVLMILTFLSVICAALCMTSRNAPKVAAVFLIAHLILFFLNEVIVIASPVTIGGQVLGCILNILAVVAIDIISFGMSDIGSRAEQQKSIDIK